MSVVGVCRLLKGEGTDRGPLTPDELARLQSQLDAGFQIPALVQVWTWVAVCSTSGVTLTAENRLTLCLYLRQKPHLGFATVPQ